MNAIPCEMNSASKYFTKFFLNLLGYTSQRNYLDGVTKALAASLGKLAVSMRKIDEAKDVETLGKMWQRAFGSDQNHPVTKIENETVYAEIHTHCPLRGTGDVKACHKMMHFDRTIVNQAGGKFIVLESQSNSGKTFCSVAMRMKSQDFSDLREAQENANKNS